MNENSGFAAFAMWNALKLHFTSDSYDYFKYNGKTNVSKQSFEVRKDKYQFYKISRKYNLEQMKDFYVANFLVDNNHWVGDLLSASGEENYRDWQKRIQALTYNFESDIIYLLDKYGIKGEEIFRVDRGQYPKLLIEMMEGKVGIETVVILNDTTNFIDEHWTPRIEDDIIWPQWKTRIVKYSKFLHYDKDKFRKILKDKVKEYAS
jgi:hypothetical protein